MSILVVGGAGYIGSHTAHLLAERGYPVVVFDNLELGRQKGRANCTIKETLHNEVT